MFVLSLILVFKQQFIECNFIKCNSIEYIKMEDIKEINIKNRAYYFFDDMINIKDFDPSLLKIDKKSYKNIGSYYIGYITMKDYDNVRITSVNPLYIIINEVDGSISEKKNGNKYLTFASTDKNKKVLEKYTKLWDEIK